MFSSREIAELIENVLVRQHGITQVYPSRVAWHQRRYEPVCLPIVYDTYFNSNIVPKLQTDPNHRVYDPTARKIFNNAGCWAVKQRAPLLGLSTQIEQLSSQDLARIIYSRI